MVRIEEGPDDLTPAEEAFTEFVRRSDQGQELDFERFCAERPELAAGLRSLHEAWCHVSGVLTRGRRGFSLARGVQEALAGRLPVDVADPSEVGGPGSAPEPLDAYAELLASLAEEGRGGSRYRLKGQIARGGMGVIVRAYDERLRRNLAMKIVFGQGDVEPSGQTPPVDSRSLGRFLEEAQVTGQLEHPGIVPVHELGVDGNGQAYFTMRLVKGRDLRAILGLVRNQEEDWTVTRALSVIQKVCEAMAFAHSKGVIHRDLKPANIMVGRFGETYVMDWGLARVLGRPDTHDLRIRPAGEASDATETAVLSVRKSGREGSESSPVITMDGDVIGTPAYMPPEQAQGRISEIGPAADIYAVGAILYHLLAGRPPYVVEDQDSGPYHVLQRVMAGPPRPVHSHGSDVPAELEAICNKAMAREQQDRYASMEDLADDLRAYLEHRVVVAYRTGPLVELRKWVERNRTLAVTVGAALAAVLILAGWALFERQSALFNAGEARAATQTARQNERTAYIGTADMAAQRGDWLAAIDSLETALSVDSADSAEFGARIARWWLLADRPEECRARIDEVVPLDGSEGVEGELLLLRALLALRDPATRDAAPGFFRRALLEGLSDADHLYVQGFLAPTGPQALLYFAGAIAEDPFHYLAWHGRLAAQCFMLRLKETLETADSVLAMFPDDGIPHSYRALATYLRGDRARAESMLDSAGRPLNPDLKQQLLLLMRVFDDVRDFFVSISWDRPAQSMVELAKLVMNLPRDDLMDHELMIGHSGPHMRFIADSWGQMQQVVLLTVTGGRGQAREEMERVCRANPCSMFFFAQALILTPVSSDGSVDHEELRSVEVALSRATELEPMLPELGLTTRLMLLSARTGLAMRGEDQYRRTGIQTLRELVHHESLSPTYASYCVVAALRVQEYDLARHFLNRWQALEPESLHARLHRVRIESQAGNWIATVAAADQIVETDPELNWVREKRQQAVRKITEAADALRDSE